MIVIFLRWLQWTDFFTTLRDWLYSYPVILSLHMVALAFFGGMILVTDLRLLGLGMRVYSISDVIDGLRIPKRVGFVFAATCGFLLFGCKADEYGFNPWFRLKLVFFSLIVVHHWVFRRSVYCNAAALDSAPRIPGRARLAGALSLLLWIGVVCAGRGIGYLHPTLEHGITDPRPANTQLLLPAAPEVFARNRNNSPR